MAQIISDAPLNGKRTGKVKSAPIEEPIPKASEIEAVGEPEIVKAEGSAPVAEETTKPDDEAIETLRRQLDAEREARAKEREARVQAERAVVAARTETDDTNLRLVENAIETVKANQASLKSTYAQAAASGEWDKAAEVQEQMGANSAKLLQLENGKTAMVEAAKRPKEPPRTAIDDPVEALANQLTPRSAAWVRAHPEYARDKVLYNKMIAAHNLVSSDYVADSDGYFTAIEDVLKIRPKAIAEPADEEIFSQAASPIQGRSSPPAAPVSRSNLSSGTNGSPRQIRLTPEQVEIAALNKMTPKEYWEQLERIKQTSH